MSIDLLAAVQFIEANARLLERRRMQRLLQGGSTDAVRAALTPYANADGGFGSALEPDVRGSHSEPTAALHALTVLSEINALEESSVLRLAEWISAVAHADGGVPFVVPETAHHPRGNWMVASPGGSHLTFGLAGVLYGHDLPWVASGTRWCWSRLESGEPLDAYSLKFALEFLDAIPPGTSEADRADAAVDRQKMLLRNDGTVPVQGGTDGEALGLLDVAPRPQGRSRSLFAAQQVMDGLDRLEAAQLDDGGWTFGWLGWSLGQTADWRGLVTLQSIATLMNHARLD